MKFEEERIPEEFFEKEEVEEKTLWDHIMTLLKSGVALVVILGLVYLSGVYQYGRYSRTPEAIQQQPVKALLDSEILVVPVNVFIVRSSGGELGSERTLENVEQFLIDAERIWEQANIDFEIQEQAELDMTDSDIALLINEPWNYARQIPAYSEEKINIFLVRSLQGINGIAFMGHRITFVADFTTVIDFRTLAHEIGHILSLEHVPTDRGRLMYRGANGFKLTLEEVKKARETAVDFSP